MSHYAISNEDNSRDVNNFCHHPPRTDQGERYESNRNGCLGLAHLLRMNCPSSRELSLALTKLEEVMFWANAAISREQ